MTITHTDHEYEIELQTLRTRLLEMGHAAEEMITKSIRALAANDIAQVKSMIRVDNRIDQLEMEIDALCLRLFALRQPVASDLRFIATAFKSATILERVGDIAVTVSERLIELQRFSPMYTSDGKMRILGESVQTMLHNVLDALARRDAVRAYSVIQNYTPVSTLQAEIVRDLLDEINNGKKGSAERALKIETITKSLKRLAGHAMNLAEMVVFMVTGEDIRHAKDLQKHTK